MNPKDLHELIDSCRPGHTDVDQPELSELARELAQDPSLQQLFARSQELDDGIKTAFQSVTPPPGLADRLLEAIEKPAIERDEARATAADTELQLEPAKRSSRGLAAIWAGVASLAAVAAIAVSFQWSQPISSSDERGIAEIVDQWNVELDGKSWGTVASDPAPGFPTWGHLKIGDNDRWHWVSEGRTICYDLANNDGKVRLFVIKPDAVNALPTFPPGGYPSPNGWHVGAWQANDRVYYLAVKANGDSKRLYLRVISSPLA